ncbi:MAG: hypothetical protein GX601_05595 [Anaerolineales bacterium]|nr:hypothetical protein [Anaerolineales bacterium]
MARKQKNMRLTDGVITTLTALAETYGSEAEAVAIAVERLYEVTLEVQTKNKAFLDIVRERLVNLIPGLTADRITFKHEPSQTLSQIPMWTDIWFPTPQEKEAAVAKLEAARIQPHPVSITSGDFLCVRTVDVSRATA